MADGGTVSPIAIGVSLAAIGLIGGIIALISVGERDQVAMLSGRVVPVGEIKTIKPGIGGRVLAVHVADGQRVVKGQVLLTFDPVEHAAERARLDGEGTAMQARVGRLTATIGILREPLRLSILARDARRKVHKRERMQQAAISGHATLISDTLEASARRRIDAYAAQMDEIEAEMAERNTEQAGLESVLKEREERVKYMTERAAMLKGLLQSGTASRALY